MHDARAAQDRASLTVAVVGERLLRHLAVVGRKPTTLATYRSALETHLLPALGALSLGEVDKEHVENLMAAMQGAGKAAKTRANALVLLHQLFHFAERNCARVDRPQVEPTLDIRFLSEEEFKALLEAVDVAAMTGLRQGELLALRWRDVDWRAERIRVRRNYVRGTGAHRSPAEVSDRCRSGLESRGSSSSYAGAASTTQVKTSSSGIPVRVKCSTTRSSPDASSQR
jgi:integrase